MYFHNKKIGYGMKRSHYPIGLENYLLSTVQKATNKFDYIESISLKDNQSSKNNSSIYIRIKCKGLPRKLTLSFRTHEETRQNLYLIHFRLDLIKNVRELKLLINKQIDKRYCILKGGVINDF